MLEEEAMNKKAQEEKIRQEQAENDAFFLEFGVVRAYCATHYCGDWRGSFLEEVAFAGLGGLEFFEFVHVPQRVCPRSFSLAVTSSGLSSDVSDAGLPSKKVMASGMNGDDGDLLLFRDGPGAYDISAGALRLFISWECSRPVAGVKVNSGSGNWVAREVGESILLGMECPVASCSGELSSMLLEGD
ncbi:hypothetical protein Tco_0942712 [Tanacetum coccineum]